LFCSVFYLNTSLNIGYFSNVYLQKIVTGKYSAGTDMDILLIIKTLGVGRYTNNVHSNIYSLGNLRK